MDTAGLRQTEDVVEQEGIRRSYEEAHKADIILLIVDRSRALTSQEMDIYKDIYNNYAHKCILVHTKADLPPEESSLSMGTPAVTVSTLTHESLGTLHSLIEQKIQQLFDTLDSPFLLNKRHAALLVYLEEKIHTIQPLLLKSVQYELVSYHIHDTLTVLSELTGKSISEAGLDKVFKEFCVGK